ncbi:hypothetical protein [Alloactinosynnema sp. L-07]|nr:hypothetical protein [Alloactinosynnema sp. L-07]CRK58490.1 hypothetical protein [Alloactinosynnema sp. L-07]
MRKNPALTFQGALRILGKYDSPAINKLLGGARLWAAAPSR